MPSSSSTGSTGPLGAPASPAPTAADGAGLTPFEAQVVALFVEIAKAFSLPKSYAEIYGLLYASAHPLTFAEIEAKLGLSKGSISQGLRALRKFNIAISVTDPTERRERFVVTTEMQILVTAMTSDRLVPMLQLSARKIAHLSKTLRNHSRGKERATLTERVETLQEWRERTSIAIQILSQLSRLTTTTTVAK